MSSNWTCKRLVESLQKCDGNLSGDFVRGLLAGDALPDAGVPERGPVDYEAFVPWLCGRNRSAGSQEGGVALFPAQESPLPSVAGDQDAHVALHHRAVPLHSVDTTPKDQDCSSAGSQDQVLQINVGGLRFETLRSTLARLPKGSTLRQITSAPADSYFVDRDGRQFHHILSWLRGGPEVFVRPDSLDAQRQLYREAVFYGILDLVLELKDVYPGAPLPPNEEERYRRLESLGILHTCEHQAEYDCITQALRIVLDVPIVLVSLVADDHQWFKSRCGLAESRLSRNSSFCAMTFEPQAHDMLVIADTLQDKRVCENPLVLGEPHIRFYAGCPLVTSDGIRLGALCVIDRKPRVLEPHEAQLIGSFAQIVVQEIQRDELMAEYSAEGTWCNESLSDSAPSMEEFSGGPARAERMREALDEMVCLVEVRSNSDQWPIVYANPRWNSITGINVQVPENASMSELPDLQMFQDFFKPFRDHRTLQQELRNEWMQGEPRVFALCGTLTTSGHWGNVTQPASCRFVPVGQPLDIAAAAVNVNLPTQECASSSTRQGRDSHFYFVLMITEGTPRAMQRTSQVPPRQDRRPSTPKSDSPGRPVESAASSLGTPSLGLRSCMIKPPKPPFADVRLISKVGEGAFGKVYNAKWSGVIVAVKVIEWKDTENRRKMQAVLEGNLSCTVSHPNIVQTFMYSSRVKEERRSPWFAEGDVEGDPDSPGAGKCFETWIVQEWCELGPLSKRFCNPAKPRTAGLFEVLSVIAEVAEAGAYLHSRGIVHGDLVADNVLLRSHQCKKGYLCKVCDFGVARVLEGADSAILTQLRGTITHMPPELLLSTVELKLTPKADVFAAGVLLWSLATGRIPFQGETPQRVVQKIASGVRLELSEEVPQHIHDIFLKSTATEPHDRPTFQELTVMYQAALSEAEADAAQ